MNKHLKLGIGLTLLMLFAFVIVTTAIPPDPPITVKGFVFSPAGSQLAEGTNVTINNTATNQVIFTTTSGGESSNTGFYQADINGTDNKDNITIIAFNQSEYGYNSSLSSNYLVKLNVTINDSRVSEPILLVPANDTFIITRSPSFAWNNSYDRVNNTGMARNYTLQISANLAFTQIIINVTNINETAGNTTHNLSDNLATGTWYWRVQAFQTNTSAYSRFSKTFNFTILSVVSCSLNPNSVDFGGIGLNVSRDTLTDNPRSLVVRNSGNLLQNISINASSLWQDSGAQNPSRFYQWKITDNTTNSFTAANTTTFLNMSTAPQQTIQNLRYANSTFTQPAARIELNITSPEKEPPGFKKSNITVTCES